MAYELPELPYPADALEPYIDQKTMEIHHGKHHAGYVEKLNSALEQEPSLLEKSLPELLANECRIVPESIRTAVRNNGGGHANHELFWTLMSPDPKQEPGDTLIQAIDESFGGLEKLKQDFHQAAISRFGSGWAWVVLDLDGKLEISSTPNQDSPLMTRQSPVLALDVWEHAYYLKYQNRRADYVQAWWNVVDWAAVERRYTTLQKVRPARADFEFLSEASQ